MFGLGLPELIIIFLAVFILFGAKALPDIAKGLGQAIKMFKKEVHEIKEGVDSSSKNSKITPAKSDSEEKTRGSS